MISDDQKLEMVVYIARKLGWSIEAIGKLHPLQFVKLYNELIFQESFDKWKTQYNLAVLLAAIYNTIPKSRGGKTFSAKDFYDILCPTREGRDKKIMSEVDSSATKMGIILPKE